MDESIKKNLPYFVGAGVIIGGIYWLRRNSGAGTSNDTGYSVVNPPDNSQSIAAAASLENSRLSLASMGFQSIVGLTSDQMKYAAGIESQKETDITNITLQKNQLDNAALLQKNTYDAQLAAANIQTTFALASQKEQDTTAFNIQQEQDQANINLHNIDANTQNNAIHAAQATARHHDNTAAIIQGIGLIAMLAFCYNDTGKAADRRRIYTHGDIPSPQLPGRHRPIPIPPPNSQPGRHSEHGRGY